MINAIFRVNTGISIANQDYGSTTFLGTTGMEQLQISLQVLCGKKVVLQSYRTGTMTGEMDQKIANGEMSI